MIPPPPTSTLFPYTTLFRSTPKSFSRKPFFLVTSSSATRVSSRSEEHTSELQSHSDLVCRLLLEKKKGVSLAALPVMSDAAEMIGVSVNIEPPALPVYVQPR